MTEEIIKNGFWCVPENNHIKYKSVTEIKYYKPTKKLQLHITQLDSKTALQQKKLIESWCEFLPTIDDLDFIWLPSRVNQQIFDAICQIKSLKGLWIKWSGIKNIDRITNLRSLEHFHLGSSGQVESIECLSEMTSLSTLNLEQLNKIIDFSPLSKLTQLEGLGVDGSIWTAQKINDLKFIEPLKNLKYFTMTNSRLKVKNFDPILQLPNLKYFSSSWNYPESEFDKLKLHPTLKYGNIETSLKEIKAELDKKIKGNGW
jgi:hypothetical protein